MCPAARAVCLLERTVAWTRAAQVIVRRGHAVGRAVAAPGTPSALEVLVLATPARQITHPLRQAAVLIVIRQDVPARRSAVMIPPSAAALQAAATRQMCVPGRGAVLLKPRWSALARQPVVILLAIVVQEVAAPLASSVVTVAVALGPNAAPVIRVSAALHKINALPPAVAVRDLYTVERDAARQALAIAQAGSAMQGQAVQPRQPGLSVQH